MKELLSDIMKSDNMTFCVGNIFRTGLCFIDSYLMPESGFFIIAVHESISDLWTVRSLVPAEDHRDMGSALLK